jgi:hypothetical protein
LHNNYRAGMAGSFGFEARKVAVAQACGERVLLPGVRAAADDTLIVADGHSCREQIAKSTGWTADRLAEPLDQAIRPHPDLKRAASAPHAACRSKPGATRLAVRINTSVSSISSVETAFTSGVTATRIIE